MAAFNKFDAFVEAVAEKVHNLGTDTLKVYLSNATPSSSADAVFADLADIAPGNGYTAGGNVATQTSSSQTAVYRVGWLDRAVPVCGALQLDAGGRQPDWLVGLRQLDHARLGRHVHGRLRSDDWRAYAPVIRSL